MSKASLSLIQNNIYKSIFDNTLDCIAVYKVINEGEDFEFVDLNSAGEKLENVNKNDLIGRRVTKVFPAVVDFGLFDIFVTVYKSGETSNFPLTFYDDERISGWRENTVYKLDEYHIMAVYSDITKIKQAEQELKKTLSFLKSHQLAMNESSIVSKSDLQGYITYVNDNFCKVTGYSKEEVIGKPHSIIRHPDNPSSLFHDMWKTIKSKKIWKHIIKNIDSSGNDYWVDSTVLPILDDKGEIFEYIAVRHEITKMIQQQEEFDKIANTDVLTGLGNRYKLLNDIKSSQLPSLAIIDLDKFSQLNDLYGHEVGDSILKDFSDKLLEYTSTSDCYIYHLHSDEYVVLNKNIQKDSFLEKMMTLEKKLLESTTKINNDEISFNFCVAISFESKETILETANMALKIAKRDNKPLVIYREELSLNGEYENNIKWTKKIKEAVLNDTITPVFQPIVNNHNNLWEKYEALVRIKDEDELISPYFFLEISKKTKYYTEITKIMIKKSFEVFKDKNVEFSINLTIDDIINSDINKYIIDMLKTYNNGSRVVFEIVETESIQNFEQIQGFIEKVKYYGCKIAIDDFGTGYSNFEYLLKLKADYIKIDGSMIKDIDTNKNTQLIVSTIIDFAKKMNMKTIAEYVENESILNKVKEMGIDYSQGYYFSEPKENIF
jgi:PAS domain S-box-containing protein/diguanylate cyclase (GGDEF)-like protein